MAPAPFSTVLPFLIAAPLSNFVVVGIIFATFGFGIAAFYFLWTFLCAVIAGLTVGGGSRIKHRVRSLEEINGMGGARKPLLVVQHQMPINVVQKKIL